MEEPAGGALRVHREAVLKERPGMTGQPLPQDPAGGQEADHVPVLDPGDAQVEFEDGHEFAQGPGHLAGTGLSVGEEAGIPGALERGEEELVFYRHGWILRFIFIL
jgi:hypothetical protein